MYYHLLFLLVASRGARHERTLLAAGFLLRIRRRAFARHAAYGGFADAAYDFRIHTVGDAYHYGMRGECIALACPKLVLAFAIFYDVIVADERLFGSETKRARRNGKHAFAVERINRDVGRETASVSSRDWGRR